MSGDRSILRLLESEWTALSDEGPCTWLTYRPAWVGTFLDTHYPNALFHTITVWLVGTLRGLLLLVEQRRGFGQLTVRRMSLGAIFYAWEFDLSHGEGDRDEVITAVHACLLGWKHWDLIDAAAALDTGAVPQLMDRLAASGSHALPPVGLFGYVIPCPPAQSNFEHAVAHSAMTRKRQLRRHLNRIQTIGTPVWTILEPDTSIADQLRAFEQFLLLEASGWKGRYGDTIQDDARMTSAYRHLIQQRMIFQDRLEIDGVQVAANVGIKFGDRFLSERFSFNDDLAAVSPGHLMTLFTLCDMAKSRVQGYGLCRNSRWPTDLQDVVDRLDLSALGICHIPEWFVWPRPPLCLDSRASWIPAHGYPALRTSWNQVNIGNVSL